MPPSFDLGQPVGREGLLAPTRNPANGYKLFGSLQLEHMRFIRQAQSFGFTLSEIRSLLARMAAGKCPCADMRSQLRVKIVENRIRLRALEERGRLMERAYADWDQLGPGGGNLGDVCRLLERILGPSIAGSNPEPVVHAGAAGVPVGLMESAPTQ